MRLPQAPTRPVVTRLAFAAAALLLAATSAAVVQEPSSTDVAPLTPIRPVTVQLAP